MLLCHLCTYEHKMHNCDSMFSTSTVYVWSHGEGADLHAHIRVHAAVWFLTMPKCFYESVVDVYMGWG